MKMKIFLMTCALGLAFTSNAQLDNGTYRFTDGAYYDVDLFACDGDLICEFIFFHDGNTVAIGSEGVWQRVNPNGVNDDYEGPWGWYSIQTDDEYFEIEVVNNDQIIVIRGDFRIHMSKRK
jgi:hypothetical protein